MYIGERLPYILHCIKSVHHASVSTPFACLRTQSRGRDKYHRAWAEISTSIFFPERMSLENGFTFVKYSAHKIAVC